MLSEVRSIITDRKFICRKKKKIFIEVADCTNYKKKLFTMAFEFYFWSKKCLCVDLNIS